MDTRILVVGIGGGGVNALYHWAQRTDRQNVDALAVETAQQTLTVKADEKTNLQLRQLLIGEKMTHGVTTDGNPELGKAAALERLEELLQMAKPYQSVLLVAGIGGGTGTGATPLFAEALAAQGKTVHAILSSPYAFEGKTRTERAVRCATEMKQLVCQLSVIDYEEIKEQIRYLGGRVTLMNAFDIADLSFVNVIENNLDIMIGAHNYNRCVA